MKGIRHCTVLALAGFFLVVSGQLIATECLPELKGDLNGDCRVDFLDIAIFSEDWLESSTEILSQPYKAVHCFSPLDNDEPNCIWAYLGDNASEWICTGGDVVFEQHIDDLNEPYSQTNGLEVKMTSSASGYAIAQLDINPAVDISKCHIRINYYVEMNSKFINDISFFIYDSNSNWACMSRLPTSPGYHNVEFALGGCLNWDTTKFSNINKIQIRFYYDTGETAVLYLDSIQAISNYPVPRVILSFDNGLRSHYNTVLPLLNSHGFKGVFYIVTDWIGVSTYITKDEMLQMQSEGHLIGNHSVTHRLWQGNETYGYEPLPYWECVREITRARKALKDIGIGEGRYYFCLPSGSSYLANKAPDEKNEILNFLLQYSLHVRMTTDPRDIDGQRSYVVGSLPPNTYPNPASNARLAYAINARSLDYAKEAIDRAVKDNSLATFFFHDIGDESYSDLSEVEFEAFLDYIQSQGCQVVTFADIIPWN